MDLAASSNNVAVVPAPVNDTTTSIRSFFVNTTLVDDVSVGDKFQAYRMARKKKIEKERAAAAELVSSGQGPPTKLCKQSQ